MSEHRQGRYDGQQNKPVAPQGGMSSAEYERYKQAYYNNKK